MIGLLVDAAIAVVIVLDRLCAAVEKAARPPVIPPDRSADAPPAGTGSPASAASAGGHPEPWIFPDLSQFPPLRPELGDYHMRENFRRD